MQENTRNLKKMLGDPYQEVQGESDKIAKEVLGKVLTICKTFQGRPHEEKYVFFCFSYGFP